MSQGGSEKGTGAGAGAGVLVVEDMMRGVRTGMRVFYE
jgi:hypothetical protein